MPETYRSAHTGSIADLMRQQGQVRARQAATVGQAEAQQAAASGQVWGQAIQNIGQGVSGTLADFARQKEQAPVMALRQKQVEQLSAELAAMDTASAQKKIGELAQMVKASGYDPSAAEPVFGAIAKLSPDYAEPLQRSLMEPALLRQVTDTLISQTPGYKAPEPERPHVVSGRLIDPTGKVLYEPPPEPEKPVPVGGRLVKPSSGEVVYEPPPEAEKPTNPTEASLAMLAAQGNAQAAQALQKLRALRAPHGGQSVRQPVWVVGPDGKFQDLAGVAPPGSTPAGSREQGRPVASGDANRIADLDTSLDDVQVLGQTLNETKDATGITAQAGAALPNAITNLTGWGTDAKKRQGVIDRVKQVIGKALEGGVLRKEDEMKYAKILPTIGDPPEVAASKLEGLRQALVQRRQTFLDALQDSGYDTSRFKARTDAPKDDPVDALIKKYSGGGG